jgi:hypothetical protein
MSGRALLWPFVRAGGVERNNVKILLNAPTYVRRLI